MIRRLRTPEHHDLACRLLLACAVVCVLGVRGASASSVAVAGAHAHGGDDHARYCKCRSCNPDSCCCGPKKVSSAAKTLDAAAHPSPPSSPCVKSSPCGGEPGLPTAPVTGTAKAATLAARWDLRPLAGGRHLFPMPTCVLPARRAARLDEPPEPTARG